MDIEFSLSEFRERHGRSPKVLHIGNIANNAYINAKLLNEIGFECDVICPNYYHIMACPEWEDAWIDGDIKDHFNPDWTTVNLNGFSRPKWFVHGPFGLCSRYLVNKNRGHQAKADKLWRILQCLNGTAKAGRRERLYLLIWDPVDFIERALRSIVMHPGVILLKLKIIIVALNSVLVKISTKRQYLLISPNRIPRFVKRIIRVALKVLTYPLRLTRSMLSYLVLPRLWILRKIKIRLQAVIFRISKSEEEARAYLYMHNKISRDHESLFGSKNNSITITDIFSLMPDMKAWEDLLSKYDVIQGYAIDPVYPYLAGKPYFAFEHGTLRHLPFDGTAIGTLTALAFAHAEHIFVTNTDCISNARRLAADRATVIPHPFDERRMDNVGDWRSLRRRLREKTGSDFLVFYPTRHDWVEGQGYADKANDRMLRAFAALREHGCNATLICCRWGHNVQQSMELLRKLDCEQYTLWYEPMSGKRYEQMITACDVIADQFLLGAFGGVTFRGLAAGRPVCTNLNVDEITAAYGCVPPVVNCQTEEEIREALIRLFDDLDYRYKVGAESAEWIRKYHCAMETARTQARYYLDFLSSQAAGRDDSHIESNSLFKEAAS